MKLKSRDAEIMEVLCTLERGTSQMIADEVGISTTHAWSRLNLLERVGIVGRLDRQIYVPGTGMDCDGVDFSDFKVPVPGIDTVFDLLTKEHITLLEALTGARFLTTKELIEASERKEWKVMNLLEEMEYFSLIERLQKGFYQINDRGREILERAHG